MSRSSNRYRSLSPSPESDEGSEDPSGTSLAAIDAALIYVNTHLGNAGSGEWHYSVLRAGIKELILDGDTAAAKLQEANDLNRRLSAEKFKLNERLLNSVEVKQEVMDEEGIAGDVKPFQGSKRKREDEEEEGARKTKRARVFVAHRVGSRESKTLTGCVRTAAIRARSKSSEGWFADARRAPKPSNLPSVKERAADAVASLLRSRPKRADFDEHMTGLSRFSRMVAEKEKDKAQAKKIDSLERSNARLSTENRTVRKERNNLLKAHHAREFHLEKVQRELKDSLRAEARVRRELHAALSREKGNAGSSPARNARSTCVGQ